MHLTCIKVGSVRTRTLVTNVNSARQQIKLWNLDGYIPSLNSLNKTKHRSREDTKI